MRACISNLNFNKYIAEAKINSLFGWLVADGWCWFVLREEYCWLVAGDWFVLREKYYWRVADKPSEQGARSPQRMLTILKMLLSCPIYGPSFHFAENNEVTSTS
jgi:hypothetical protein